MDDEGIVSPNGRERGHESQHVVAQPAQGRGMEQLADASPPSSASELSWTSRLSGHASGRKGAPRDVARPI
jgi:hypothetical protein